MIQLLVMAKAPVPGRVKTRLCPPCTGEQAAMIAAAALADTLETATRVPAVRRTLVIDGSYPVPPGWAGAAQRGDGLGERLAHAFADTALPGVPSLLIGMDTPQLTSAVLVSAAGALSGGSAVLGPAADGGWWALGLPEPADARVLTGVPMSTARTGELTLAALRERGLRPALLPRLSDVDTAADAVLVARACPANGRFPAAVARLLPEAAGEPPSPAAAVRAESRPGSTTPGAAIPTGSRPGSTTPVAAISAESRPA